MASVIVIAACAGACLTTMNRPRIAMRPEAPALEPRGAGCNVDFFEDGQTVTRPHLDIADVVLDWPRDKVQQQGPEGAMATLKEAACENGAFIVHNLRALTTGAVDGGLVYEATLATLLGDDGKPLNLKVAPAAQRPGQVVDDAAAAVDDAKRELAPKGAER